LFCKDDEPILDSFIALTSRGKLAAAAMSGMAQAKRLVKRTPTLFHMAQSLRNVVR
jgi:CelD/BcsL family acetyltransferase involved in cellulose biosynthesis